VKRRTLLLGALAAAMAPARAEPEVIHIVARQVRLRPGRITLRVGVPVILEFTAPEVAMGFDAPASS